MAGSLENPLSSVLAFRISAPTSTSMLGSSAANFCSSAEAIIREDWSCLAFFSYYSILLYFTFFLILFFTFLLILYFPLSLLIFLCSSFSPSIFFCFTLFLLNFLCLSLFPSVSPCFSFFPLSLLISLCLSLFPSVSHCFSLFSSIEFRFHFVPLFRSSLQFYLPALFASIYFLDQLTFQSLLLFIGVPIQHVQIAFHVQYPQSSVLS
jgi:hypothetical protein